MIAPEDPPGFVVRTEAQKAAWDNGYRLERGVERRLAALRLDHGAGLDLDRRRLRTRAHGCSRSTIPASWRRSARCPPRPLRARARDLHVREPDGAARRARPRLQARREPAGGAARSLSSAKTASLPRTTEAERLVIQRIGQDIFRDALMDYWGGRCPLTGITEPALLRASHIVPWADCDDAQRLDVHNGLLLSALWDAAFDRGPRQLRRRRHGACKPPAQRDRTQGSRRRRESHRFAAFAHRIERTLQRIVRGMVSELKWHAATGAGTNRGRSMLVRPSVNRRGVRTPSAPISC